MFNNRTVTAEGTAHDLQEPIDHRTAYEIAEGLKKELWRRETGAPPALGEFMEDGRFGVATLRSALDEVSDVLSIHPASRDKRMVNALLRYAEYHQSPAGVRGPAGDWKKLSGQEVSQ